MKKLEVPRLDAPAITASEIAKLLDTHNISWQKVSHCNWPEDYPYQPSAEFRIAHNAEAFLLNYRAKEQTIRARYKEDGSPVYTDSCMEFFLAPSEQDQIYYNLECNCIGTLILDARKVGETKEQAPLEKFNLIERHSTLGRDTFEERPTSATWEVALKIPFSSYWKHQIQPGQRMRANFYKCGDELKAPHFLSWSPIDWPKPNFHLPQYFGEITIEI